MEKPDFLPFQDTPIPEDHCLQAVRYIVCLSMERGCDLQSQELYTVLTGQYDVLGSARQTRIMRRLASVANGRVKTTRVRSNEHLLDLLAD